MSTNISLLPLLISCYNQFWPEQVGFLVSLQIHLETVIKIVLVCVVQLSEVIRGWIGSRDMDQTFRARSMDLDREVTPKSS